MAHARGKYAKAVSDRSGMEFPYKEMVKEWNGSLVHRSEFEPKHPQLKRFSHSVDPQSLKNARTARTEPVVVNVGIAGDSVFGIQNSGGTQPAVTEQKLIMLSRVGEVTVTTS
jgi:hypothetical protein